MANSKETQNLEGQAPILPQSEAGQESPPEWLAALKDLLDRIDPKDSEKALKDMEAFVEGDATWREVQGIPKKMLFDMAEKAYLKFKGGRLEEAKKLFIGLSLLDHTIAYFHTAMGAIYQKEQKYFDALAEYTVAIELDPQDITAYVNRGETYYLMGLDEQPLLDLEAAIRLDPGGKDPWANRARFLQKKILSEMGQA